MPMPAPRKGEDQDDFVGRCMGDDSVNAEFPDTKQRAAACYASWRKKHGTGGRQSAKAQTKVDWFKMKAVGTDSAEIMIYDEIGMPDFMGTGAGSTAKDFATRLRALGGDIKNIDLRINSPGGSAIDALAMYNLLKEHPAKKTVKIDGIAASAASLLAMVGDKIIMPENTFMLIHNPHTLAVGDAAEMRKVAEQLETMEASFAKIYAKRSGRSYDEIKAVMTDANLMSAREAMLTGFADELGEAVKMQATFDLKKLPEPARMVCAATMKLDDPPRTEDGDDQQETEMTKKTYEMLDTPEQIKAAWDFATGKDALQIPAADLPGVKEKIIAAWKEKIDAHGPVAATAAAATTVTDTEMSAADRVTIHEYCLMAGFATKAPEFIKAKMSPEAVRTKLIEMRAAEDERTATNSFRRPGEKSQNEDPKATTARWDKHVAASNERLGRLGRA